MYRRGASTNVASTIEPLWVMILFSSNIRLNCENNWSITSDINLIALKVDTLIAQGDHLRKQEHRKDFLKYNHKIQDRHVSAYRRSDSLYYYYRPFYHSSLYRTYPTFETPITPLRKKVTSKVSGSKVSVSKLSKEKLSGSKVS